MEDKKQDKQTKQQVKTETGEKEKRYNETWEAAMRLRGTVIVTDPSIFAN